LTMENPPLARPEVVEVEELGYISFVINVHDWVHAGESADTLLHLVDLFEQYGVRGDFYVTAPIVEAYVQQRPDVIERLRDSKMTISYHVRPPHPLYSGFDERLQGLSDAELAQTVLDYETYGLDLATGDLDRSRPGGYSFVAQVFGRNPVVASAPNNDRRIKQAAQEIYAQLGAKMSVMYHEEGADPKQPFEYFQGLLVRPSDFSITRTTIMNGKDDFWWNYMTSPEAASYQPLGLLEKGLAKWQHSAPTRLPFITSLIHENNFYRRGAEAWSAYYYTMERGKKTAPLRAPFDLGAPDPSTLRLESEEDAIWQAYEALVAFAASHLYVVTSEDFVQMANK